MATELRGKRANESTVPITKKSRPLMDPYENRFVAFDKDEEEWLNRDEYKDAQLLVGIVQRKLRLNRNVYYVNWTPVPVDAVLNFDPSNSIHINRNLMNYIHLKPEVSFLTLAQGREMFYSLGIQLNPLTSLRSTVSPEVQGWNEELPWELQEDTLYWQHDAMEMHVKQMNQLRQDSIALEMLTCSPVTPEQLYNHSPTRYDSTPNCSIDIKPLDIELVKHSATASFLAYLPLSFWEDITQATNTYGILIERITPSSAFDISEVMAYMGILLHINLIPKYDKIENYWIENSAINLEIALPYKRFQLLHSCFIISKYRDPLDPLTALRPLIQTLQQSSSKLIVPGRDLTVASITERSQIVDQKHVELLCTTDTSTGIVINFKVHISFKEPSPGSVTQNVLDLVYPWAHSHRIINVHSNLLSVSLFERLRIGGYYARGLTRLPECLFSAEPSLIATEDQPIMWAQTRFNGLYAITKRERNRLALGVLTNVDNQSPESPILISIENQLQTQMRLRQLHRSSSFRNDHKAMKHSSWAYDLVMDIFDVARVNAFLVRNHVLQEEISIWSFTSALSEELISGEWKYCPPHGMRRPEPLPSTALKIPSPPRCVPRRSKEVFLKLRPGKDTRCKTRQCVVCRWECGTRSVTEVTDYCSVHDVCLCSCVRQNYTPAPYMCQNSEWTCWEKFHNFYMPEKLFVRGCRIQRGNRLYKLRNAMAPSEGAIQARREKRKQSNGSSEHSDSNEGQSNDPYVLPIHFGSSASIAAYMPSPISMTNTPTLPSNLSMNASNSAFFQTSDEPNSSVPASTEKQIHYI